MFFVHLRRPQSAALALSLTFIGTSALGQTAPALQMRALAATRANCHGTEDGAVQGDAMARLAGLPKDYIVTQILAFREGERPATGMHHQQGLHR